MKKYNMSKIMKRAWELVKKAQMTISAGLKKAWEEAKTVKNAVVEHFGSYNARRYSAPWICVMTEEGRYDFDKRIGCFTGYRGEEGDLVVTVPVTGTVYGYGQKDYRGSNTVINYAKWNGLEFVSCDRLGRIMK